ADNARRLAQTLFLTSQSELSLAKPQQATLLAYEALRQAEHEPEDADAETRERLQRVRWNAEKVLRKVLAGTGGKVYFEDIGPITHVAVHEHESPDSKSELRWIAAAGTDL